MFRPLREESLRAKLYQLTNVDCAFQDWNMKRILIAQLAIGVLCTTALGQHRKPTPKPKTEPEATIETGYPLQISTADIAIHRVTEKVCTLSFTNTDPKRTISNIKWWVKSYDPLTHRITGDFSFDAEPVQAVTPNQAGAVADLLEKFFPDTKCILYRPKKTQGPNGPFFLFVPSSCTGDALFIDLRRVKFSDGSTWEAPDTLRKISDKK
jgi:hypothetical protein